jgi:hypothetical protein
MGFVGRLKARPRAVALRYGCETPSLSGWRLTQTPYNLCPCYPRNPRLKFLPHAEIGIATQRQTTILAPK